MAQLLTNKKFAPFFWTQFLGAFNNNVFKNALAILIAFKATSEAESGMFVAIAGGLFILPLILFSSLAGQWSDKFDKVKIIKLTKLSECVIMIFGALGFYFDSNHFLLFVLFLMGVQTAFFGPAKYSLIPQSLNDNELMAGTSLVETGTFLAILLGTILGGILVEKGTFQVSIAVLIIAFAGYATSLFIPSVPVTHSDLKTEYNPFKQFLGLYRVANQRRSIWISIVAISWFWFLGATLLSQLPTFVKFHLKGDETLVTALLTSFTLSLAFGSYLCNRFSTHSNIELGLVPLGAIGMSIFCWDLSLIDYDAIFTIPISLKDFLLHQDPLQHSLPSWRILIDFFFVGCMGSFYIVPLYALLQRRSSAKTCSQVIAANNVLNSFFMVGSAIMTSVLYGWGFDTRGIFKTVAVLNIFMSFYVFLRVPEFILRFGHLGWVKRFYHLKLEGEEVLSQQKGAMLLILQNDKNFRLLHWCFLTAICQRPVSFVVDHDKFNNPMYNWFYRLFQCIPSPSSMSEEHLKNPKEEMSHIISALKKDRVVCIKGKSLQQLPKEIKSLAWQRFYPTILISYNMDPMHPRPDRKRSYFSFFNLLGKKPIVMLNFKHAFTIIKGQQVS